MGYIIYNIFSFCFVLFLISLLCKRICCQIIKSAVIHFEFENGVLIHGLIFTECNGIKFTRVGCYKDNPKAVRTLPQLVLTYRDPGSKVYTGEEIDWLDYEEFFDEYICKCAKKVVSKGYRVLGLQYYGKIHLYT